MGKERSGKQLLGKEGHWFVSEESLEFRRKAQQRGYYMEERNGGASVNSAHIRSVLPQMREEAVIFVYSESNYMLIKLHEVNN